MGTNHYVKLECPNPCDHCKAEEYHIGKSGRMIQGHRDSPWGPIESWQDWKKVLLEDRPHIVDEYGSSMSVEELIDYYESTAPRDRARQYRDVRANYYGNTVDGTDILDADNFSVCFDDFC